MSLHLDPGLGIKKIKQCWLIVGMVQFKRTLNKIYKTFKLNKLWWGKKSIKV